MSIKFFYADSLDQVDPGFDFVEDRFVDGRIPQRDDVYAHELMDPRPYDGLLVSKSLFDERWGAEGRYTQAQRHRFLREGAQRFLRFPKSGDFDPENFPIMGDCGAFSYREEEVPPYSIDEVVEFYEVCGFTLGVSVDHMIGAYNPRLDGDPSSPAVDEYRRRFDITLELAAEFLERVKGLRFEPLGAVQGWSPQSYAEAARRLVAMGYRYLAVGGLVPLKTAQILEILAALEPVVLGRARLHLLGVTRLDNFDAFRHAGVISLDSTSPLRRAFKDAKQNYYSDTGHYSAVRVPQSDSTRMLRLIQMGRVRQEDALKAERDSLTAVRGVDAGTVSPSDAVAVLRRYHDLYDGRCDWVSVARTLEDRPWQTCPCPVCLAVGVEVVIFRGANRNRRRGFHNLWWTHQKLSGLRAYSRRETQ